MCFFMENLTKLVKKTPKILGLGIVGASLCGLFSCASLENMTDAQKIALAGNALSTSSYYSNDETYARGAAILGSTMATYGQMKQELDVAEARSSKIIINNNLNTPKKNYEFDKINTFRINKESNGTPRGLFMYQKWTDKNGDEEGNKDEYYPLNSTIYDLNNSPELIFSFYSGKDENFKGDMSLNIWNGDGEIIHSLRDVCNPAEIQNFICRSESFFKDGDYKAVLSTANGKSFSLNFKLVK